MTVPATQLATRIRQSTNWADARTRVLATYRDWIRGAPEMQTMYSLPVSVSAIRTRIRDEFERNRFVNKLAVVDVLLFKSHADYQETMNFWRQTSHMMSYFADDHFRGEKRLPSSFMEGFIEGRN